MPISDLTNTTWVIKEDYGTTELTIKYINFTSNNNNYTSIEMEYNDGDYNLWYGDSVVAFYPRNWTNYEQYKTITITGGSDVTNATLISWLEANATQQTTTSTAKIGNKNIVKKNFGSKKIIKEVVNTSTIWNN